MTFVRAMRSIASKWDRTDGFSSAPLRLADFQRVSNACRQDGPGVAEFPRRPLAFLWHYVRRRPFLHAAALISVLGAASFACVAQFGLKLIVDAMAAGPQHIARVWWALALFAALLAGESALWRFGSWFGYRAILVDKAEAKLDLFDHLSGHSSRYFSDRMGGSLANRISSTGDSVQQVFSAALFNIAPVCADFCAALAMLATVEWHLVAALFVFVSVAAGTLIRLSHRGMPRHRFHADRAAEVGGELVDVLSNIWVVKAFSARTRERRRFERLLKAEQGAHSESLMYVERMRVLHDVGLWLMAGGMLAWTLHLWSEGRVSPGDVILTLAMAFRILHGSRDLAFALVNTSQFIARIADSIQVIGENHRVVDEPGAQPLIHLGGSIEFDNVDFSYPSGHQVFDAFNLRIAPGQRVGLVGPSGAGKSTLIGLVQRLADVDDGRILIDDQDIVLGVVGDVGEISGQSARRHRRRAAGHLAVSSFGVGKHSLRQARGDRRGGARGGESGAVRRLHSGAARRLRHDCRRARYETLRWSAATARGCPSPVEGCPHRRARRGHFLTRQRVGDGDPAGARSPHARPHRAGDRPSPFDGVAVRPRHRAATRLHRRGWRPRRAAPASWVVRPYVSFARGQYRPTRQLRPEN